MRYITELEHTTAWLGIGKRSSFTAENTQTQQREGKRERVNKERQTEQEKRRRIEREREKEEKEQTQAPTGIEIYFPTQPPPDTPPWDGEFLIPSTRS